MALLTELDVSSNETAARFHAISVKNIVNVHHL
jgi:hypothetical protein